MQVAVEDAVDHRAFHERDHPGADHGLGVDTGLPHAGGVVEVESLDPLHHEDPAGDERGCGRGTTYRLAQVAEHRAMSSMLAASTRKSSSSTIVSANNSTSAGGLASAATGMRPTRCGASQAMTLRSRGSPATSGRCTLTTTSSPLCSRATCTWAMDAAASGVCVEGQHLLEATADPPRPCAGRRRTTRPAPGRGSA